MTARASTMVAAPEPEAYVRSVPTKELSWGWPLAVPHLARVFPKYVDEYDLEHIRIGLASSESLLWLAYERGQVVGACVTEILCLPNYKKLLVIMAAGQLSMFNGISALEDFARAQGCRKIAADCRPGVAKRLREQHGFHARKERVEKELS